MKVILQVDGREMTFSGVENITILEEGDKSKLDNRNISVYNTILLENHPLTAGKWFWVDAKNIDRKLFEERREGKGEIARKLIWEAFEEVKKNPNKYARKFSVMIPEKNQYSGRSFREIMKSLENNHCHIADWVELALMWAQRISNGESWEVLYDYHYNTSSYHRVVVWKNNQIAYVGGSIIQNVYYYPEQYINPVFTSMDSINHCAIPVIASHTPSINN